MIDKLEKERYDWAVVISRLRKQNALEGLFTETEFDEIEEWAKDVR